MATLKEPTAVRLKPDTRWLLERLADDTGLSKTGVVELAIRDLAKQRKITLPDAKQEQERA